SRLSKITRRSPSGRFVGSFQPPVRPGQSTVSQTLNLHICTDAADLHSTTAHPQNGGGALGTPRAQPKRAENRRSDRTTMHVGEWIAAPALARHAHTTASAGSARSFAESHFRRNASPQIKCARSIEPAGRASLPHSSFACASPRAQASIHVTRPAGNIQR